jgi:hypothetical protein
MEGVRKREGKGKRKKRREREGRASGEVDPQVQKTSHASAFNSTRNAAFIVRCCEPTAIGNMATPKFTATSITLTTTLLD